MYDASVNATPPSAQIGQDVGTEGRTGRRPSLAAGDPACADDVTSRPVDGRDGPLPPGDGLPSVDDPSGDPHTVLAVALVRAAAGGLEGFADAFDLLLAEIGDFPEHPLHGRFDTARLILRLAQLVVAVFPDDHDLAASCAQFITAKSPAI